MNGTHARDIAAVGILGIVLLLSVLGAEARAGGILITIDDVTSPEGNIGTTPFDFTVRLSEPAPASGVSFLLSVADGTALVANTDYASSTPQVVALNMGETAYTFRVNVIGDTLPELDEVFFVNVSNPSGATVADGQATGTILNEDAPVPVELLEWSVD
jgi:hypothetical protein